MRRTIGISCAAVILAGAMATTWGGEDAEGFGGLKPNATNVYKGDVDGGGQFYFEAKFKKGEPTKMGYVLAISVPVECAEGTTRSTFLNEELPLPIKVRKRKFKVDSGEIQESILDQTSERQPFKGSLTGKLAKDGRSASGTLDFEPVDLSDEKTDCETNGPRRWKAKLTNKFTPH